MGQNLLLNWIAVIKSLKLSSISQKTGTSQTDRHVINEKLKEERIQHETFTYCDRCQFYRALFLPKKRDCFFKFSLISLHNFCTAPVSTYPSQIERLDLYVLLLHLFAHIQNILSQLYQMVTYLLLNAELFISHS